MKTQIGRTIGKVKQIMFQLLKFIFPHRKAGIALFCVVLILGFLWLEPASAQFEAIGKGILWAISKILLALSQLFIGLSVFFLKFFTELARYNGYINTPTVVLGWLMVRDVVNMFFVIVLLIIAFGTILGIEQYEWKKTLVKFVLAAILINFSNLICGIIIDVAHVFTITFLNAVSAAAGGNLINMFHLTEIYKMATKEDQFSGASDMDIEIFIAAIIAFFFAGLTLISMLAYTLVMIARVVVLWVLIILSPIAFIAQVIPTTQQYAKEWWNKFGKQVVVAPIMVFFLWLAFATLGTGDFLKNDLNIKMQENVSEAGQVSTSGRLSNLSTAKENRLSLSDVSTWENMANFLIATAFLFVGLGVVNKLGVVGGGVVSGLTSFGRKVATIASGYATGRWLVGKGTELGKTVGKKTFMATLGEPVARMHKRAQRRMITTPYLRRLPIVGGFARIRREKLNEEAERSLKMAKENLIDTISRPENLSWRDKWGKKVGVGISSLKKVRYELEEAEETIRAEKTSAKRLRKESAQARQTELALQQVDVVVKEMETEEKEAVEKFIYADPKRTQKYAHVDESSISQDTRDKWKQKEEKNIDAEVDLKLRQEYDQTEGMTLANNVNLAQDNLEQVQSKLASAFEENIRQKLGIAAGEAVPTEYLEDEELKKQFEVNNLTLANDVKIAEVDLEDAQGARKKGFEDYKTTNQTRMAQIRSDVEKENGTVDERLTQRVSAAVLNKNKIKDEQAHREFINSKEGKEFAKQTEEALFAASDRIARGKEQLRDKKGNVVSANATYRQAVAEKMREHLKGAKAERFEAQRGATDAKMKEAIAKSAFGTQLIMATNIEEQAKKAAESFTSALKSAQIEEAFTGAAKKMAKVVEDWKDTCKKAGKVDIKLLHDNLQKAADEDRFVAALQAGAKSAQVEKNKTMRERQAVDLAEDVVINIPKGSAMPSTVIAAIAEEQKREYDGMELEDGARLATKTIFTLVRKKKEGKELTMDEKSRLLGSFMKIDEESWNDDVMESMVKLLNSYKRGTLTDQQDIETAKEVEEFFNTFGMKFEEITDEEGKFKNIDIKERYGRRFSAIMQDLSATGDLDAVRLHDMVSRKQRGEVNNRGEEIDKTNDTERRKAIEEYKKDDYWGTVEKMAGNIQGYSAKKFKDSLMDSQDFLQVATRTYKMNGIRNGHWESAANQKFDDQENMYRFRTYAEADAGVRTEMAKRSLNDLGKTQIHAFGELNLNTGLMERISTEQFAALTRLLTEAYEVKAYNSRTLFKLFGYHERETEVRKGREGEVKFGGKNMLDEYKGREKEMDLHIIKDLIMPELMGNARGFGLMAQKLFGIKQEDVARGNIKIEFETAGQTKNIGDLAQIIKKMKLQDEMRRDYGEKWENKLEKISRDWAAGRIISTKGSASEAQRND